MRSSIIAIVLCSFTAAAAAQCVAQTPVAAAARPEAELIKTAAAATRERALAADDGPSVRRETAAAAKTPEQHPRRAGAGMLLAAVALMSGIALRYIARMK